MSRALADWIAGRGGSVAFRDFMAAALYDPDFGYYTRNIRGVGERGDFSTAATLDRTLLGSAAAGWIRAEWKTLPGPRNLIEIGAGDGSLARAVLGQLGWCGRRGLRYHVVDISPPLVARQREALAGFGGRVRWHGSLKDALEACGGEAILLSNELVDAFPATVYRHGAAAGSWAETLLVLKDGRVALGGRGAPDFRPVAPEGGWPDGQAVEVHESYREWLGSWAPAWRCGSLLTIDYGDTFPALYHRRPRGTLRAYFRRQRLEAMEEILARFGKQDLTCDVNFSDLLAWGEGQGFRTRFLETQGSFLRRFAGARNPTPAQAYLLDEDRAGGAFKVLAQARVG